MLVYLCKFGRKIIQNNAYYQTFVCLFHILLCFYFIFPALTLSSLISYLSSFTSRIYYLLIEGVILASIDEGQREFEIFVKMGKNSWKSFGDSKNSRTFASAFRARPLGAQRKEFFERLT
jgi:hypothetical protein